MIPLLYRAGRYVLWGNAAPPASAAAAAPLAAAGSTPQQPAQPHQTPPTPQLPQPQQPHDDGSNHCDDGSNHAAAGAPQTAVGSLMTGEVLIVWDIENVFLPQNLSVYAVLDCLKKEFAEKPQRHLRGWFVGLSKGSMAYNRIGQVILDELSNMAVGTLLGSGKGKLGDTDQSMKNQMNPYIDSWVRSNRPGDRPPMLVLVSSDADFHNELMRAVNSGIEVHRVYLRGKTSKSVANMPRIHNREYMDLIRQYHPHALPPLDGSSVPETAPTPRASANGAPQQQRAPLMSDTLQVYLNLVQADGTAPRSMTIEGPIRGEQESNVFHWLRPVFQGRPGFLYLKAYADRTFAWVNFATPADACGARDAFQGLRRPYTNNTTGQSAQYELAITYGKSNKKVPIAAPPAPEVLIADFCFDVSFLAGSTDCKLSDLKAGFLADNRRALILQLLAPRLMQLADANEVALLPPCPGEMPPAVALPVVAATGKNGGFKKGKPAAAAASKGLAADSEAASAPFLLTDDLEMKVKGTADNIARFKDAVQEHGLGSISQTVLAFDPSVFLGGRGQALPGNAANIVRRFGIDKLRLYAKVHVEKKYLKPCGVINYPTTTTTATKKGKKSIKKEFYPPDGKPFFVVITCAPKALPPKRLSVVEELFKELPTKLWRCREVQIPEGFTEKGKSEVGKWIAERERGMYPTRRCTFTALPEERKYLVWGLAEKVEDEADNLAEQVNKYVVGAAKVREARVPASKPVVFSLMRWSQAYTDLRMDARDEGVRIRDDSDLGDQSNNEFVASSSNPQKLRDFTMELERLLADIESKITATEIEVPAHARCLFLPNNIDVINECVHDLGYSKERPVYITMPEGGIRIKGFLFDNDEEVGGAEPDAVCDCSDEQQRGRGADGGSDDEATDTAADNEDGDDEATKSRPGFEEDATTTTTTTADTSIFSGSDGKWSQQVHEDAAAAAGSARPSRQPGFERAVMDIATRIAGIPANGPGGLQGFANDSINVNHRVTLVQGNITQENSQLLVNAANGYMQHAGGVALALATAAGFDAITKESQGLRDTYFHGCVPPGQGVLTGSEALLSQGVQFIFHAAPPVYSRDDPKTARAQLASCVWETINTMKVQGLKTCSMPLFGAGTYGWPEVEACNTMLSALNETLMTINMPYAIHVRIVEMDDGKAAAAAACFSTHRGGEPVHMPPTAAAVRAITLDRVQWCYWVHVSDKAYILSKLNNIRAMPLEHLFEGPVEQQGQGVWYPMSQTSVDQLEMGRKKWEEAGMLGDLEEVDVRADNWEYTTNGAIYRINFRTMEQVNVTVGGKLFKRKIKRTVLPPLPPMAAPPGATTPHAEPEPEDVSNDTAETVVAATPAAMPTQTITPTTKGKKPAKDGGPSSKLGLRPPPANPADPAGNGRMKQAQQSGNGGAVLGGPNGPSVDDAAIAVAKAAARAAALKQAILTSPIKLVIEGQKDHIDKAAKTLQKLFSTRCKEEEREFASHLSKLNRQTLHSKAEEQNLLLYLARKEDVTAGWVMRCGGMLDDVASFVRHVWDTMALKVVQMQAAKPGYYPDTWSAAPASPAGAGADDDDDASDDGNLPPFLLVDLLNAADGSIADPSYRKELAFVSKVWESTMDVKRIVQIQRVQNTIQYDQFQKQKELLLTPGLASKIPYKSGLKYDPTLNSSQNKWLWHGTRATAPKAVTESFFFLGSNWSNVNCLWGPANYFAENASYSAGGYEHTRADGTKQLLLCEVLTGYARDYGTTTDSTLRQPPEIPASDPMYREVEDAVEKRYSSVSGITGGSRVYMTYTHGAVRQYPHYIVTYK